MLAEHALVAEAVLEDVGLDLVGGGLPRTRQVGVTADRSELRRTIESDPAHELRGDVLLGRAAGLPDALIGVSPDLRRALRLRLDDRPQPSRQALAPPSVEEDRVEDGAEHVVLPLVEGAVADPHGPSAGVAGKVVSGGLRQVPPAVDPVHDLQRPVLVRLEVGDELHELVGFPVEVHVVQRLQREGRIPHPRVAVVPVALAPRCLGQRSRERGHGRAGRHVRQALDREGRALDRVAPAVVGQAGPAQPGAPEVNRCVDALLGILDVGRRAEALGPGERAVRPLPCGERVARPHPVAFDPEREVRLESNRLIRSAAVRRMAPTVDQRPLRRRPAVIEAGLTDELDLDRALEALDRAHEHVVGVVVGRRACVGRDLVLVVPGANGQGIADDDPTRRRPPGRGKDVGPRLVHSRRRVVDAEGPEAEGAGTPVEQAAEDARGVERWNAQPVDGAVRGHERAGVAVGEKRVVRDRRERRGCGRALGFGLPGGLGAHDCTQGPCHLPWPATRSFAASGPHDPGAYG